MARLVAAASSGGKERLRRRGGVKSRPRQDGPSHWMPLPEPPRRVALRRSLRGADRLHPPAKLSCANPAVPILKQQLSIEFDESLHLLEYLRGGLLAGNHLAAINRNRGRHATRAKAVRRIDSKLDARRVANTDFRRNEDGIIDACVFRRE